MSDNIFLIRQCSNPHCRLRFPVTSKQLVSPFCPKCGYRLKQVNQPFSSTANPTIKTTHRQIELSIMLDNVRSAFNVGSILRTCEGSGVKHIYLCGITPTPDNPKVGKTALNADGHLDWSYHPNALDLTHKLKRDGICIWSLEITPSSIPLVEAVKERLPSHLCLVAGNERSGVDPEILDINDQTVHLPMSGIKQSFNIAVALGSAIIILLTEACV